MYLGHIVETGPADEIYRRPMHPYSRLLLSAVPRPDPDKRAGVHAPLRGELPSPLNKPSGCAFRTRCPIARPSCADAVPPLQPRQGREVACPYSNGDGDQGTKEL
jgi:oligopeptide/dipeptide ABC transporter ATP-binding protein